MPNVAMKRKTTGWTTVALGDVAINSTVATQTPEEDGFTRYIIGKHIPGDGDRITTWGDVGDGEFGSRIRTVIKPGDIVCTTRGPKLRVAVATFDCLSAHTNFVLRTKDAGVMLQEYLQALACSDSFQEHLRRNFRGSTNLFVNWSDAAKFQFALPPIEEQRRITAALLASSRVVEAYSASERALERLGATYLSDVIGQLVRSCRSDALATLAEVQYGLTISSARRHAGLMRPYLRVANVGRGYLDLSEMKETGWLQGDEGNELQLHDVLFVEGHANAEEIGRAALWNGEIPGAMHQNHIIRARCRPGLDPRYLLAVANSPYGRGYFRSRAKSSSGLNTINSTVVKEFAVPLASPEVQDEVVRVCAQSQEALNAIRARRERATDIVSRLLTDLQGGVP